MNTLAPSRPFTSTLQRGVQSMRQSLQALAAAWQTRRRRRTSLRELEGLDEHLLRDIGLKRSELSSVVAELTGTAPTTRRLVEQMSAIRLVQ